MLVRRSLAFRAAYTARRCLSTSRIIRKKPLLGSYDQLPRDLFRINATAKVILRDFDTQQVKDRRTYDVCLQDGMVEPSPETGSFEGPNGMAVRPNTFLMQELVRLFKGRNVTIYKLPAGLDLKSRNLKCLWEHTDQFSIQTTTRISLMDLNKRLNALCKDKGQRMSKDEFCEMYPFDSAEPV